MSKEIFMILISFVRTMKACGNVHEYLKRHHVSFEFHKFSMYLDSISLAIVTLR